MAAYVLTDTTTLVGGYNLSGSSNSLELSVEAEQLTATHFRSNGSNEYVGGLKDIEASLKGYWEAGASKPDELLFSNLAVIDVPVTFAQTSADGSVAYGFKSLQGDYSQFGDVGELAPFEASLWGRTSVLAKGNIIHSVETARTASGTGTGVQLGTVASGKRLVALLHVTAASGTTPSLTVTLQRDDNAGFTSPVTAHTFAAKSAVGYEAAEVLGPITPDDRYRITWAISGTSPSFNFAVFVGIG